MLYFDPVCLFSRAKTVAFSVGTAQAQHESAGAYYLLAKGYTSCEVAVFLYHNKSVFSIDPRSLFKRNISHREFSCCKDYFRCGRGCFDCADDYLRLDCDSACTAARVDR